ncbi:MAG: 50S ribosomal protein L31 [Patescibacteria group bacterium]
MKSAIHPQYYDNAKVRCACGNTWTTGSTRPEISLEICNQCHPFYTGREKVLDTRGRIEKFKKRAAKAKTPKTKNK